MKSRSSVRLYNVLFPIWGFWLWPSPLWLALLAGNFAIDSLVVCLAAGKGRRARVWQSSILRVWLLGYACDLAGAVACLLVMIGADALIPPDTMYPLLLFPWNVLIALPGVLLAGVLLYFANRRWSFRRCGLNTAECHRLSLALAVFTAPWTMLIPLYG